jgi:hypothetical protein
VNEGGVSVFATLGGASHVCPLVRGQFVCWRCATKRSCHFHRFNTTDTATRYVRAWEVVLKVSVYDLECSQFS